MFSTPKQIFARPGPRPAQSDAASPLHRRRLNSVAKEWDDPTIRSKIALAFPDIYELGGSNLGLMILYDLINKRDGPAGRAHLLPLE